MPCELEGKDFLKNIRESKGINKSFIAKKLGIDRNTVTSLEEGQTSMKVEWLPELSFIYGMEPEKLIEQYLKSRGLE